MGLLVEPVVKKFLANKIESSQDDWGDYLLEIADIFSTFDGEDLDRDLLASRFSEISPRSPYSLRDVANFRDEFGAYGTYLGVFRFEKQNGQWKVLLSNSAKHFLCSTEPDVESFCRAQMALFQYPNGAGAVVQRGNSVHMQSNVKRDTVREIQHNIRINPFRLLCKAVVAQHEMNGFPLAEIEIEYKTLFMLMNDDRINQSFSPSDSAVHDAIEEYRTAVLPLWTSEQRLLTNFKRNFHIFERTGLFTRSHDGLLLSRADLNKAYGYIQKVSDMTHYFRGFDSCYGAADLEQQVKGVVVSPEWGRYFDAFTLPVDTLVALSDDLSLEDAAFDVAAPLGAIDFGDQPFPPLNNFQVNQIRAFTQGENRMNPAETLVRREKANREHARILALLASRLRAQDHPAYENTFIDLCSEVDSRDFIFEVKSNNAHNALSQIRKAIAQLYEYRYRSQKAGAALCIVMQQKPKQEWVVDYLLNDRDIYICWMVDDVRLESPPQCYNILSQIGVI